MGRVFQHERYLDDSRRMGKPATEISLSPEGEATPPSHGRACAGTTFGRLGRSGL
jgi:hypothetical protein